MAVNGISSLIAELVVFSMNKEIYKLYLIMFEYLTLTKFIVFIVILNFKIL